MVIAVLCILWSPCVYLLSVFLCCGAFVGLCICCTVYLLYCVLCICCTMSFDVFPLDAGPATSIQVFLGFPVSLSKC
jgi:hypothetical protein